MLARATQPPRPRGDQDDHNPTHQRQPRRQRAIHASNGDLWTAGTEHIAHTSNTDDGRRARTGRVLTESDTGSSLVTTTTVSPQGGASLVQISTSWDGAGGIGGLFERMFAPRVMRAIYADELNRLDAYAREHRHA